jgi:hypothetical protein
MSVGRCEHPVGLAPLALVPKAGWSMTLTVRGAF